MRFRRPSCRTASADLSSRDFFQVPKSRSCPRTNSRSSVISRAGQTRRAALRSNSQPGQNESSQHSPHDKPLRDRRSPRSSRFFAWSASARRLELDRESRSAPRSWYLLGELVPKTIYQRHANRFAPWIAYPHLRCHVLRFFIRSRNCSRPIRLASRGSSARSKN